MEFLRVEYEAKRRHFLEESLQVEPSLVNELGLFVTHDLFGGQVGDRDAGPSSQQFLVEFEELTVSSLALPGSVLIDTLAAVADVATPGLRVEAEEFSLMALLNKVVSLVESFSVDNKFFTLIIIVVLSLFV